MDRANYTSSKAFKRFETNLHGKLNDYFLSHYSHYLVPGCNAGTTPFVDQWDIDNIVGLDREYPYNCDFPRPLLPPAKISKKNDDRPLQLIVAKAQIDDNINRIMDHCQKYKKSLASQPLKKATEWKVENGSATLTIPRYAAELAVMMEADPDPQFSGNYNWYHTGGSLANVTLGGRTILLFPYMGDLVAAPIKSKSKGMWNPNLRKAASCQTTEMFYELRKRVQNNSCRILARSKNICEFYSVAEDHGKLRMLHIHQQHTKLPLVSADLDPVNFNIYCTMNIDRTIILWDMISSKKITGNTIETSKYLDNNWGTVRFAKNDPHTLIFTDRCCINYLDIRQPFEYPVLKLCPKASLDSCESLCLELPSESEHHSYVGSYHSLLMCDWRMQPDDCVQQKWIHQFKSTPLFASVHTRDEKEAIVLSSQLVGETSIMLNTWGSCVNAFSHNIPRTPPSIVETLREALMQGKCLDPALRKRLELSTCGNTLVADENGDLSLFIQNSAGDIFYQCITHDEALNNFSLVNSQSYYAMEAWEKRILLQDPVIEPLVITERSNMHHVFDYLTDKSLIMERDPELRELHKDANWKQTSEQLKEYADILAPELMAVWEASDVHEPISQPALPHQKVMNWLETADDKFSPLVTREPQLILTPIDSQELYSVSQQPKLMDIGDDALQDSYYASTKVKSGRKPQTKKRTYVAGF